jgi:hypothetical protein
MRVAEATSNRPGVAHHSDAAVEIRMKIQVHLSGRFGDGFQNPVQRRLSRHDLDELVSAYLAGSSIDSLAVQLGVHRTTVMDHLERRGVQRRRIERKLTDRTVREAAKRYGTGESLKVVAIQFDVDARTLAREFRRAGVRIRPRRGWPPSI